MSEFPTDFEDLLVTIGRPSHGSPRHVNAPIDSGSTILFDSLADFRGSYERRLDVDGPLYYGRYGTLASKSLESALARLEGAAGVTLTSSGVAAIACALQHFSRPGSHLLVADNVYGNTRAFCDTILKRQGVEIEYFDPMELGGFAGRLRSGTCAVMLEAPGSATFEVPDTRSIAAICRQAQIPTILDSTWASPIMLTGLSLGIDVLVYSGSKYLCGHSDAMLGVIAANQQHHEPIRRTVMAYGDKPGAQELFLALRGLRTLSMRMHTADRNGRAVAEWLASQPKIARVLHPALPDSPGHEFWKRDFRGACGLFSLQFHPCDDDQVDAFVERLKHFGIGVSWGGFESLALPMKPMRVASDWDLTQPLVRFAIGFENPATLIEDLAASLAKLELKD